MSAVPVSGMKISGVTVADGVGRALAAMLMLALCACAQPSAPASAGARDAPRTEPPPQPTTTAEQSSIAPLAPEVAAPSVTIVPAIDVACTVDADCAVKNVGNCCGYYPACVNVASETFPELVAKQCAETGTAGICGFPAIASCICDAGRCAPSAAALE